MRYSLILPSLLGLTLAACAPDASEPSQIEDDAVTTSEDASEPEATDDRDTPPLNAVTYRCEDLQLATEFYEDDLVLTLNGQIITLPQVRAASGAKYEGETSMGSVTFWSKGDEASLDIADQPSRTCQADIQENAVRMNIDALQGKTWIVEDVNGGGVPDRVQASLEFDGQSVTGSTGCNSFRAGYEVGGDRINISAITTTKKACPEALMNLEARFLEVLSEPISVEIDETGALLIHSDGGSFLARTF